MMTTAPRAELERQIKRLKKRLATWEAEATERGKGIEKFIGVYRDYKSLLPESFKAAMSPVVDSYLKRNTVKRSKGSSRRSD